MSITFDSNLYVSVPCALHCARIIRTDDLLEFVSRQSRDAALLKLSSSDIKNICYD